MATGDDRPLKARHRDAARATSLALYLVFCRMSSAPLLVKGVQLAPLQEYNAALAIRYLTLAGFVLVLQNIVLSFRDEVTLVWRTRHSFGKYIFLFNRYLVPCSLFTMFFVISGFQGITLQHSTCRSVILVVSVLGVTSLGIANLIILQRVRILWDGDVLVTRLLCLGYVISFAAAFTLNLMATLRFLPGVIFLPELSQCVITRTTWLFPVAWAAPMLFEIMVLGATAASALSRRNARRTHKTRELHQDGIVFFLSITCLRALNLGLSATFNPALSVLCFYIVWAIITVIVNRAVLRQRRLEVARRSSPSSEEITELGARTARPLSTFTNATSQSEVPSAAAGMVECQSTCPLSYDKYNQNSPWLTRKLSR